MRDARSDPAGTSAIAVDPTEVLDTRVRKLLRGETIHVRGAPMKMRLSNKLWKLCVLFALSIVLWALQARQAMKVDAWANGFGSESVGSSFTSKRGHFTGTQLLQQADDGVAG